MSRRRVLVSACLLGRPVRWKGDSKPCDLSALGDAELVPFCPEVAAGFGCPRPPIELEESPDGRVRVVDVATREDRTEALRRACEARAGALAREGGADLFVLKARSPSCGKAALLHDAAGRETGRTAPGEWARCLAERFPDVPILDETELA